jgi:hypothetical protein
LNSTYVPTTFIYRRVHHQSSDLLLIRTILHLKVAPELFVGNFVQRLI